MEKRQSKTSAPVMSNSSITVNLNYVSDLTVGFSDRFVECIVIAAARNEKSGFFSQLGEIQIIFLIATSLILID